MTNIKGSPNEKVNPIKHINSSEIFILKDLVECKNGKVESLTVVQRPDLNISLMAIYEGEGLSTHSAPGEAFLTILEGDCKIMIEDKEYVLKEGESIIMPSNKPHSVYALSNMKMILILIK